MPKNSPTVEVVDVTPEMAQEWLSKNPNNRNMRKPAIDAYARDMTADHWVLNGETIKLSETGHLLDGQHRLSAVIVADLTVSMIVVSGIASTVMATVDTGVKRTYADALRLQGEQNTATLAAVTRKAFQWARGSRSKSGGVQPTALELNEFLSDNGALRTAAEVAQRLASKSLLPASTIGLCHWLFSDLDPDAALWFLARLADGDGLSADDPIAVLRNRIVKMRVTGARVNETESLALCVLAWNAYRAGVTRTKLQLPKGGLTAENFPEPR